MDELKFAFGTTVGGECKILIFSCSVSGFIHFNLWVSNWDLFVCFIFLFFVVGCFVDVMKMEGSPESVLYVLSRTVDILNWKKKTMKEKIADILFTLFPMFLGIPVF
jgi:hypothetical protein